MAPKHDKNQPAARPSVADLSHSGDRGAGGSAQTLLTRRQLLYGAVGVGALAAIGVGAATCSGAAGGGGDSAVSALDVPKHLLSTLNDFEALDTYEGSVQLVGEWDLPYGSLVWACDESIAACLLPTETGSPLAQVGLLFLGSGDYDTVLEKAVGAGEGYEIYDARANSQGLVWTEANIMRGTWRVYSAPIAGGALGEAALLEEGGDEFETPTLAVAGGRAFWQANAREVDPDESDAEQPPSRLMAAAFGASGGEALFETARRMSSPPYAFGDTVTIAPRADSSSVYYQLTNLNASTGEVLDALTLPHAIAPIEAGYGKTGFMFSFPDIYDYDGAIANLGTYTPHALPADGNYDGAQWFDFSRTPTAAPAWCGNLLVVKSTYSVCGVDLDAGTYFAIDVDDGSENYGDYLASTGMSDTFVTYTNIDHTPVGEGAIHTCRVKVWAPL